MKRADCGKTDCQPDRLTHLAERIAERSCPDVLRRVRGVQANMSAAEIRGYIRARAASVVHREIDRALRTPSRIRLADRNRLLNLVTEAIVVILLAKAKDRRRHLAA